MNHVDMSNPVLAVAMLTQQIAQLEGKVEAGKASVDEKNKLSTCLQERGGLLMVMGDKQGAENDMKRFLELNPEKVGELTGEFKAEGREHCR